MERCFEKAMFSPAIYGHQWAIRNIYTFLFVSGLLGLCRNFFFLRPPNMACLLPPIQFTRDVAVFSEARALFSVGGRVFHPEPVTHAPMEDTIFEESRNVTIKLHRRVARFVKLQLFFAAKWIMVSEVAFESTRARGEYLPEQEEQEAEAEEAAGQSKVINSPRSGISDEEEEEKGARNKKASAASSEEKKEASSATTSSEATRFMPVIIGVLLVVIVLLGAVIFFIVSRSRRPKFLGGSPPPTGGHLESGGVVVGEKQGSFLHPHHHPHHAYAVPSGYMLATSDTTGSSGSKGSCTMGAVPKLDDNYNTPHQGRRRRRRRPEFPGWQNLLRVRRVRRYTHDLLSVLFVAVS